jgi:hypothetical protein
MLQLIWAPLIIVGIGIAIVYFVQHLLIFVSYMPRDARTNVEKPDGHNITDWEEVFINYVALCPNHQEDVE